MLEFECLRATERRRRASSANQSSSASEALSPATARWAAMMITHHQSGIELTRLATEKASNPAVRDLARQSMQDQQPELFRLQAIAQAGGVSAQQPEQPIMRFDQQQMMMLRSLSGATFDRQWLDVLSSHHMAAIMMTGPPMAVTGPGDAQQLETSIQDGQLRQIEIMNQLR